jgi:hypothetical protein
MVTYNSSTSNKGLLFCNFEVCRASKTIMSWQRKLRIDRIQLPEKYKENSDVSSEGPALRWEVSSDKGLHALETSPVVVSPLLILSFLRHDMIVWKPGKLQSPKMKDLCLMLNCTSPCTNSFTRILKAHSMSRGSIRASLECHCCFWIAGGLVSYLTMWLLTLQLFKNSVDTQEKLWLNLHSLSVSVSELLEYRRLSQLH